MVNRMQLAKDALTVFIQSLPLECQFTIISFGSRSEAMKDGDGNTTIKYSDASKDQAISQIASFQANFGGTDILSPLKQVQEDYESDLKKRVFLLTDGAVMNPQ